MREDTKEGWRWFGTGIGMLVAFLLVVAVITVGTLGYRYLIADPKGRVEAEEQIKSGSNRIAQYDKFFDACGAIKSAQENIALFEEELPNLDGTAAKNMQATILAAKSQLNRAVQEYNADAAKSYTNGQFRASELPYHIEATEEVSCAN